MNDRGLAIVFAEDVPTITNSNHPGKKKKTPTLYYPPFIFRKEKNSDSKFIAAWDKLCNSSSSG